MKRVLKRLLLVLPIFLFLLSIVGFMALSVFGIFWVFTGEYIPEDRLCDYMDKFDVLMAWANR